METLLPDNRKGLYIARGIAASLILEEGIQFYILFYGDNAFEYTKHILNEIPTIHNYLSILDRDTIAIGDLVRSYNNPEQTHKDALKKNEVTSEMKQLLESYKRAFNRTAKPS